MTFFSEKEEKKLIRIVSKYAVIYDTARADYRDNFAKENVWKVIGQEMKKNSEECKKKWKFVRDGYQRFKKRRNVGRSVLKNSKIKRHKLLTFLDDIPNRHAGPNVTDSTENIDDDDEMSTRDDNSREREFDNEYNHSNSDLEGENAESFIKQNSDESDRENTTDDENIDKSDDESSNDTTTQKEEVTPTTFNKIKNEYDTEGNNDTDFEHNPEEKKGVFKPKKVSKMGGNSNSKSPNQKTGQNKVLKSVRRKKDDTDLFTRHIAYVLRNLPLVEKAKAKKHLNDVLSEYEIMAAKCLDDIRKNSQSSDSDSDSSDDDSSSDE